MEGRCTECNNHNVALHHYQTHLCYDCYEKLFTHAPKVEDEPDFEIKSDVAIFSATKDAGNATYLKLSGGQLIYTGKSLTIKNPKRMVFNETCRVKDYDKLVLFLLENMAIYDNAKGFDKVSYMFKEYKEDDK
jgi:hypothetical protein